MGKLFKNIKKAVNKAIKKENTQSIVKKAAKQVGSPEFITFNKKPL